jgi:hypothetical protein
MHGPKMLRDSDRLWQTVNVLLRKPGRSRPTMKGCRGSRSKRSSTAFPLGVVRVSNLELPRLIRQIRIKLPFKDWQGSMLDPDDIRFFFRLA